jgi:preprotein translocase subunit YajC
LDQIAGLLPLVLIIAVFYLLIIRPQRNRARQAQEMQSRLTPGQRVMTTAGLFATISAIEDDAIVLEISPGITSRWAKAAISRVLPADDGDTLDEDTADEAPDAAVASDTASDNTPDTPTGTEPSEGRDQP